MTHRKLRFLSIVRSPWLPPALAISIAAGSAAPLLAAMQPDSPPPPAQPAAPAPDEADDAPVAPVAPLTLANGRRTLSDEPTTLAFKSVSIDQVIPFIVESTGKVVLPQQDILARRITLLNDQPIPRSRALDLVFIALQQSGVGVVETRDLIILRDINEITRQDVPVLGPDEPLADRTDLGAIVEKVFALNHASAANIGAIIKDSLPEFVKYYADADSNQIVVMGNIALLQRLERLITSLDRPNAASLDTRTFRLRYADAAVVAENIRELFGTGAAGARTGQQQQQQNPREAALRAFFGGQGGGGAGGQRQGGQAGQGQQRPGGAQAAPGGAARTGDQSAVSSTLRVTSNTQQNSLTVVADPQILDQIERQIDSVWDQPLPEEAVVPRIYDLKNSDPVKVRSLLEGLFGAAGTQNVGGTTNQGVGRLAGQFSFQAIPEAQRLVVISKSPDNLAVIDRIIEGLDQPLTAGLPRIVELRHASAEELSEQLNALLSQEGTQAQIRRAESGLSTSSSTVSPFASTETAGAAQGNQQATSPDIINFWWQRARPPTDSAGSSNLVGKVRIVPVWRQNAVMIMGSPEYQESIARLIEQLDRPGKQVLISAIIVELSKEDADALGIRWSNTAITPNRQDNTFGINSNFSGQQDNFLGSLFNTSVLDVNVDLNVMLQALNEKTDVSILSEPRIFTSDNQEAEFFDGQDIPFITDTQTSDQGSVVNSFDYRAVGISLKVRPRITPKRDVDLKINLELSSIQPQATLFGGFIVDRRESTTQLIVRDGQTVVLSGIMRSEDSDVKRKVPILGDIPLIGLAFRSTEKVRTNTELVAFITPIVVENPEEADSVNEQFRKRLREMRDQLAPGVAEPMLPPASSSQPIPPRGSAEPAPAASPPSAPRRPQETGSPG